MPRKCYKTRLCQSVESKDKNLRLVDLDETIKALVIGDAKEQMKLAWGEQHLDKNVALSMRRKYVLDAIELTKKEWFTNSDR